MKKNRWILSAALLLVAGFCVAGHAWLSRPRINAESFQKIEFGMTRADVTGVLSCRPHYRPGELKMEGVCGTKSSLLLELEGDVWESEGFRIYVCFDHDGKCRSKMCSTFNPRQENIYQKLGRWVGLPAS